MAKRQLHRFILGTAAAACCLFAAAVPPMPGVVEVAQPDGTTFSATIMGDAGFHWYVTPEGTLMMADMADGFIKPVSSDELEARREAALEAMAQRQSNAEARVAPAEIRRDFPTTGTVRGLIIMAEFQDVKFQPGSTREYFDTKVNQPGYSGVETYGSVNDFFAAQSKGVFTPEFDIIGPVTLPKNRADYGLYEDLDGLFRDSAHAAQDEFDVDFSRYDVNGDRFVDFLFVIFAGHGQAQGGPEECIWPAMKDITEYVFDSFGGMYLGVAACSCELKGGSGANLDGVGTICHEFSHILGLPDVYDAMGTGGYGMGHFDMMCYGPYNDDGRTPCNYTSMEKFTLGWIQPMVLDSPQKDVTLRNFGDTNDCAFIVNPENPNEYYTLENRQLIDFDSALPGHGLVISYCHYDRSAWVKNSANSPTVSRYEHINIIPADNSRNMTPDGEAGDPWPGSRGKTEFTDESAPGAVWRSSGKPVSMPITNIRESEDGVITFDFMIESGVDEIAADAAQQPARYFNLQGLEVDIDAAEAGIYLRRTDSGETTKFVKRAAH